MDPESERREVNYRGLVQGVGFRYATRQIAERFRVTGFVRNLPNGSVELVAEGARAELDRFLNAVAAEMAENIRGSDLRGSLATGEFEGFSIRR